MLTMEAYLDNSATTRCSEAAKNKMVEALTVDFGNPSSMHMKGVEAEKYVKEAATAIAKTLRCQEKEIVFTSGGTESNNLAIIGTALANQRAGRHIITTSVEHASVKNTMRFLEEEGFEITYLPVDANGEISLEDLKRELREDTILVPKGIGFLYIKEKTKIRPISFGGDQQKGMRSGTINVPGIAGLGVAAAEAYAHLAENAEHMYELKAYFADKLQQIGDVTINGKAGHDSAPQIISASFLGVRSEVLLHSLEDRNIYVSAGSACSSNHPSQSGTLLNIGLDHAHQESTLRFSFCPETTREELDYTYGVLEELLPMLRRYTRH